MMHGALSVPDPAVYAAAAPLTFSVVSSRAPLVKRFSRKRDGTVTKSAIANLYRGTVVRHQVTGLHDLVAVLDGLTATQACIWGVTGRATATVVAQRQMTAAGDQITRTREHFAWPEGPGIWMLDVDPAPGEPTPAPDALVALLRDLHPLLADAAMLWRPSASSGVDGGGITGQRIYLAVADARRIEDAGAALTDLLWVAGHGRVRVSAAGTLLAGTLVDAAPWNPTWLDFAGPPLLEGVTRQRLPARLFPGNERLDLTDLIAAATPEIRQEAAARRVAAQQARAAEARETRRLYVERRGLAGLPLDPTIEVGFLPPDHELIHRDGRRVTVRELVADRSAWDRAQFADPEEPDYGDDPRIAVALLDGPEPRIYSHAHGGRAWALLSPDLEFEDIPDPSAPEWRVALARARENAREEADAWEDHDGIEFASVQAALLDPAVLTVQAKTGAGKTHTLTTMLADTLRSNDPQSLLIVAVDTLFAMTEIEKAVRAQVDATDGERFLVLRSGEPSKPLVDRRSGARPYRAILCSHAAMTFRGDDPRGEGRLLRKLEIARDVVDEKAGDAAGEPLAVFIVIDEGDAYLARLERVFPLGYRARSDIDPRTRRPRVLQYRSCPKDCANCALTAWQASGLTVRSGAYWQYEIKALLRAPEHAEPIDFGFLRDALGEPETVGAYSIFPIDATRVPDLPAFIPSLDEKSGDLIDVPNGPGILAELATTPGATVRMCHPRGPDGHHIEPGELGKDTVWPPYACNLPTLVSWDPRPLRKLYALSNGLRFLSATYTETSRWILRRALGERRHARVPTPDERKLSAVLVLVVPKLDLTAALAEGLTRICPVLYVLPREKDVDRLEDRFQSWRTETLIPGVWKKRMLQTTDPEKPPTFLATYARSSIARGANLGRYRILIVDGNAPGAMMNELCLGTDPLTGIETARRSVVYQASGRNMRWDATGEDDGLRVLIYVGGEDPLHHRLMDDGAWLGIRHEGSAAKVPRVVLDVHPDRLLPAVEEFLATGDSTVTDATEGNRATLSRRQRDKVDATFDADERRAERRAAKRQALQDRIEASRRDGLPWWQACRGLNLTRHFSKEELAELKAAYEAPR